jgi:N-acetylmuramic acid 6-phosphate (MurNAc-6-P) etherase
MAVQAMREAGGNVKLAAVMAGKRVDLESARQLLEEHRGRLREVLES